MKKLLIIVFSVVIGFSVSFAQGARPKKPGAGPVPKAAFPPFADFTLKNGLRVILVEDRKQPIVYFRTLIMSGSAADGNAVGAATAVSGLLQKGTKSRNADEIAEKLDYYGAELGASGGNDNINITISCLKKDMKDVLPIYFDVIKNPSFPKDELEKYRSQTLSGLKSLKRSSAEPGRRLGRRLTYPGHPYGNFETEETVNALTVSNIEQYHSANFVAANTLLAVVGDVTKEEITALLEKNIGDWKKGERAKIYFPPLPETKGMNFSLVDRPNSVQSTLRLQRLAMTKTDPDYEKASFLAAIWAGNGLIGFQNRLFQNIREKHGYTYTPGGSLTSLLDRGVLVGVAEVRNSVTDSALDQMILEYRRLSSENIPESELNFAKGLVTGKYLMELADPQATSAKALDIIQYGLPKDYYSGYPARVEKFTAEELRKTGEKVYPPNDLNVLVTGDASKIISKLERFGKFNAYDLDLKPIAKVDPALKPAALSLEQVIDKFWTANNKPAREKITSYQKSATVTIVDPTMQIPGTFKEVAMAPNLRYEVYELKSMPKIERKNNGTKIYEYQNGQLTRGVEGADLANEQSFNLFNKELILKEPLQNVKLRGIAETQQGDCYVLTLDKVGAGKETWYITDKSWNLVRRVQETPDGDVMYEYSDFRNVDGIPMAYKTVITGPLSMNIDYTDIKLNTNPDKALFEIK